MRKTPALSVKGILPVTSALFAMLPGQPVATPVAGRRRHENHITPLPSLLRGDMPSAPQEEHIRSLLLEHEKGKPRRRLRAPAARSRHGGASLTRGGRCRRDQRAKVEVDSRPAPVTHGAAMPATQRQRHGATATTYLSPQPRYSSR